jgi:hypothetical protein
MIILATRRTFIAGLAIVAALASGCVEEMKSGVIEDVVADKDAVRLYSPTPDEIMLDTSSGLEIVKDVIYVTFRRTASEDTAKEIIASVNGVMVGYDKTANLYQVRFPGRDLATIDGIRIQLLADHSEVEVASRLTVSSHKDPYYVR